jgi:hypothetical protein
MRRRGAPCEAKWSPDGRWIAYTDCENDGRRNGLWLIRPDGSHRHRLSLWRDEFWWSPDGKKLALLCLGVCLVDVDQGGVRRLRLPRAPGVVTWLSWSPDGRRLALEATEGEDDAQQTAQIWVVGLDGRGLNNVTSEGENRLVGWMRLASVLPPALPLPPSERVLGAHDVATRAVVGKLSADGPRVAFVAKATATDCEHLAVWMPREESLQRVGPRRATCSHRLYGFTRVSELALADGRVAWAFRGPDPDNCATFALRAAALADSRSVAIALEEAVPCTPEDIYHLHGAGDLLVFNDRTRLVRVGSGRQKCQQEGGYGVVKTSICATLRRGADAVPVDAVFEGLIAIRRSGAVTVLDDQGKLVRSLRFDPADVSAARLDGEGLVVSRTGRLEFYEVATGAPKLSRPLPSGYRLADADGGIAVLLSTDTVLLLRLADGHSLPLGSGRGPALADLEPSGLYYSYATSDGGGRVVFVPRSEVVRQLG